MTLVWVVSFKVAGFLIIGVDKYMFKILIGIVIGVMLVVYYPQLKNMTNDIEFKEYQVTVPVPILKGIGE